MNKGAKIQIKKIENCNYAVECAREVCPGLLWTPVFVSRSIAGSCLSSSVYPPTLDWPLGGQSAPASCVP